MYIAWVHYYIPKVFTCLSFIVNPCFVYLIFTDKKAKLGNYRFLLAYFATFNVVYSIMDLLIPLAAHSYRYCYFGFVPDGPFSEVNDYSHLALLARCSMVSCSYAVLVTHFVYRYMIIYRNELITRHFIKFMMASFLLAFVYFAVWAVILHEFTPVTSHIHAYIHDSFTETFGEFPENFNAMAIIYNEALDSSVLRSRLGICLMVTLPFLTIIFYVFIGRKILSELGKSNLQMSLKTKKMQRNLLEALVVQTVIPIVVSFLPMSIFLLAPAVNIQFGRTMNFSIIIAFTLFPFFDPIAIVFCVPVFRNRVFPKIPWASATSISGVGGIVVVIPS